MNRKIIFGLIILFATTVVILSVVILNLNKPLADILIVKDFAQIQSLTDTYYKKTSNLPPTLDELNIKTVAKYDYQIMGNGIYKVCATFNEDVTDTVKKESGISIDYKKGYDCVTFNAAINAANLKVTKIDNNLQLLKSTFSETPTTGIVLGNFNYSIDLKQSRFYKNTTTGDYLANLFVTVLGGDTCSNANNSDQTKCCYSFQNVLAETTTGDIVTHNKLGIDTYIDPFPKGDLNTFGDLPTSFCLNGTKTINGGLSFIIPSKLNKSGVFNFSMKLADGESSSNQLSIKIVTK